MVTMIDDKNTDPKKCNIWNIDSKSKFLPDA